MREKSLHELTYRSLVGYAMTARMQNSEKWLEGLANRINSCLATDGDPRHVEVRDDAIVVIGEVDASIPT